MTKGTKVYEKRRADANAIKYIFILLVIAALGYFLHDLFLEQVWYTITVFLLLYVIPIPIFNYLAEFVKSDLDLSPPELIPADKWKAATIKPKWGGVVLGHIERTVFYFAFFRFPEFIAAWLVFKVASKWENWQNIVRVPSELDNVDKVDYLRARVNWGSEILQGFLRGTLLNIFFSRLAYLVTLGVI